MRSQRLWRLLLLASVGWWLVLTGCSRSGAPSAQMSICHKPGSPDEHTFTVSENALPAHLDHGDFFGPCKGGTTSDVVQTGTEFRLALTGGTFLAPADSLPPGVNVTLSAVNPAYLDSSPNDSDEEVFTQVFELKFSKIVPATKPITLELQIPTFIQERFYSYLRVEGGVQFHGPPDSGWQVEIGTYDPARSRLSIVFFATAQKLSVVGVRNRKGAAAAGRTTSSVKPRLPQTTASTLPIRDLISWSQVVKEAAAANGSTTAVSSVQELTSHGWILVCRKKDFPRGSHGCEPGSETLRQYGALLYESDKVLRELGLPRALLKTATTADITGRKLTFEVYDPDGRSTSTKEYFEAVVTPNLPSAARYSPITGNIRLNARLMNDPAIASGSVIHELMHAVQWAEIPSASLRRWITEGLATAVEPFAPLHPVPSEGFRFNGQWRSWEEPLNSDDIPANYQAAEFWLSVDGTLAYLPKFFDVVYKSEMLLGSLLSHDETTEYDVVNQGLTAVLGVSLTDAYLELLQKRNGDPGYPYCHHQDWPCQGDSCSSTATGPPQEMRAFCSDITLKFTPACPLGETPTRTIELRGEPAMHKAMVDGQLYEPNQAVAVGEKFRYWTIYLLAPKTMSPPPVEVVVRRECKQTYANKWRGEGTIQFDFVGNETEYHHQLRMDGPFAITFGVKDGTIQGEGTATLTLAAALLGGGESPGQCTVNGRDTVPMSVSGMYEDGELKLMFDSSLAEYHITSSCSGELSPAVEWFRSRLFVEALYNVFFDQGHPLVVVMEDGAEGRLVEDFSEPAEGEPPGMFVRSFSIRLKSRPDH